MSDTQYFTDVHCTYKITPNSIIMDIKAILYSIMSYVTSVKAGLVCTLEKQTFKIFIEIISFACVRLLLFSRTGLSNLLN